MFCFFNIFAYKFFNMKQLAYILSIIAIISFSACGNDNPEENTEEVTDAPKLKGYEELDLNQWGFEMTVMVPNADDNGEPEVVLTERGALEVLVGTGFGIEIMFGEGDIELLKTDLVENLVFTSDIIKEEEDALVYTQEIPDAGVKTQNHFFFKKQIGADVYEIRDLIDGEFGIKMIEQMLAAARTIKEKRIVASEGEAV
jgi:hypothetical protein